MAKVGRLKATDRKRRRVDIEVPTSKIVNRKPVMQVVTVFFDARGSNPRARLTLDVSDAFYGTVQETFSRIESQIADYAPENCLIDLEMEEGHYYGESGSPRVYVNVYRDATDEEVRLAEDKIESSLNHAKEIEQARIEQARSILREAGEL